MLLRNIATWALCAVVGSVVPSVIAVNTPTRRIVNIFPDEQSAPNLPSVNVNPEKWDVATSLANMTDTTTFSGYNLAKPYLEHEVLDGFTANLRIMADFPVNIFGQEGFTTITTVSIGAPDNISGGDGNGVPENIHPTWNPCFGFFFLPTVLEDGAPDCGDAVKECLSELENKLGEQYVSKNESESCWWPSPNELPESCGQRVRLVTSFDVQPGRHAPERVFGNNATDSGFSIGTNVNEFGNYTTYFTSAMRTILVATVWGYNSTAVGSNLEALRPPNVTFSCVSGHRGLTEGSKVLDEKLLESGSYRSVSHTWITLAAVLALTALSGGSF